MMEKLEKIKNFLRPANIIKSFMFLVVVVTVFSTFRAILVPLLPEPEEYEGSFPENFWKNLVNYPSIFIRRVGLFSEYYDYPTIITLLTHFFFLLLVMSIWNTINKVGFLANPLKLIESYFVWAISSLLIAIVFITKVANAENMDIVGLGILGFTLSIVMLYFLRKKLESSTTSGDKEK